MSEKLNIQYLLENVNMISNKYDEISRGTGENFNIFSVMRAESDEVRTHSRIIAELLNPKGSHGQGCVFLECFFDEIEELRTINNFDFESAKVVVEEHAGLINEDYTEGGFIDIVIKDNKNQVVIENKIYAGDQPKQLLRYKKAYPRGKLLYLTLDGKKPSNDSYGGLPELLKLEDIVLVSYSSNVKVWLEKCIEKAVYLPIIRETLVQYLNLIKKLTNQTTNNIKSMEILEILKSNVKESFEISNSIKPLKSKLYYDFFENIIQFAKINNFSIDDSQLKSDKDFGLSLKPNEWISKPYKIVVLFDTAEFGVNYSGLYVGVNFDANISNNDKKIIQEKFEFRTSKFDINQWNIWKYPSNPNWTDNPEIWEDIAKGEEGEVYKEILSIIEEIIDIEKN